MIRKKHYGALYIPTQFDTIITQCIEGLAETVGGVTVETAQGAWVMNSGAIVREPITKLSIWFDAKGDEGREVLRIRNATIRALWAEGEEAVATEGMSPGCDHEFIIYTDEGDL